MKITRIKWLTIPAAAMLFATVGVTAAHAQTGLQLLLGTSSNDLNIVGTGGTTINVNDRTCSGATCTFGSGSASTGNAGSPSATDPITSGTFLMTTPTQTALTLTPGTPSGSYKVNQPAPVTFSYTSSGGTLSGMLQFLSATNGPVNSSGVSIVTLIGTLSQLSGSLAPDVTNTSMTVQLALYNSLASLLNGTGTLTAQVETGSVAPEPASIFLFGSGLLALGFLLRSKRQGVSLTAVG